MKDFNFELVDDENPDEYQKYLEYLDEQDDLAEQEEIDGNLTQGEDYFGSPLKPQNFYYDDTGYYAYVLLNGCAETRNGLIKELAHRNIKCLVWGRSHKPANNGKKYYWYIRVVDISGPEEKKPSKEMINKIFDEVYGFVPVTYEEQNISIDKIKNELDQLRTENRVLKTKFLIIEGELSRRQEYYTKFYNEYEKLKSEYQEFRRVSQLQIKSLKNENKERLDQIQKLDNEIFKSSNKNKISDSLKRSVLDLREKLKVKDKEIDELMDDWQNSEKKYEKFKEKYVLVLKDMESLLSEKNKVSNRLEQITIEKEKIERLLNSKKIPPSQYESVFSNILSRLFGNLYLLDGSVSYLAQEVKNWSDALKILYLLNFNPGEIKAESVESAKKWKEMRFKTGEKRKMGRIYFAKLDRLQRCKYLVFLAQKKTQKNDIKNLQKISIDDIQG